MSWFFGDNNQTVTTETKLPQWVEDFSKANLEMAGTVASELTPPYDGPRVADMNAGQNTALAAVTGNLGSTNPAFSTAMGGAQGAMGFDPSQVQARSFLDGNINAYMSPYTANVEQQALGRLDDQRRIALARTGDQAAAAGAFGGSRHGVMEGVTNSEAAKEAGLLSANLRDQAYRQGLAAMESDFSRDMAAQQLNQAAGLAGGDLRLRGAGMLGDLAAGGQNAFLQGSQAALAAGNQQQAQTQLGYDADMQRYNELRGYPIEQLDIRLNALGMTPYGSSGSQTTPMSSNYGMSALGGALAGAQLAGMLPGLGASAGGWGALAGGALGLLSDERDKTDIEELGDGMYAFRYKGDPKSYPKVVGPMAQEVEKKHPDKVMTVGNRKVIRNMGFGGAG